MDIPLQQVQLLMALLLGLLVGILIILRKLFNSEFFFFFIFLKTRKKKKISALDGQPNNSVIKMKRNAKWTIYLKPNWSYDVSVTMGSQEDSIYNLNVIVSSSTYPLTRFFSNFFSFSIYPIIDFPFKFLSIFLSEIIAILTFMPIIMLKKLKE